MSTNHPATAGRSPLARSATPAVLLHRSSKPLGAGSRPAGSGPAELFVRGDSGVS
jgi:hypothetical protein